MPIQAVFKRRLPGYTLDKWPLLSQGHTDDKQPFTLGIHSPACGAHNKRNAIFDDIFRLRYQGEQRSSLQHFLSPECSLRSQISTEACCEQNMTLPITSEYSTNCMQMESRSDGCREHLAASAGAVTPRADQSVAEKAEAREKGEMAVKSSQNTLKQKEELTEARPMARRPLKRWERSCTAL